MIYDEQNAMENFSGNSAVTGKGIGSHSEEEAQPVEIYSPEMDDEGFHYFQYDTHVY